MTNSTISNTDIILNASTTIMNNVQQTSTFEQITNISPFNSNITLSIITIITFLILGYIIKYGVLNIIEKISSKTKSDIDDKLIKGTKDNIVRLMVFIGILFSISPIQLTKNIQLMIQRIIISIITYYTFKIITYTIITLLDHWGENWARKTKSTIDDDIIPLLKKTIQVIAIVTFLIVTLKFWNIDVTGLLAGAGIIGLALSFAVKDSLANIFGGLAIILDKTFKVGDKIKLENGKVGIVYDIGLRTTKLKTFDNEILLIPNGHLSNSTLKNYVKPNKQLRIKIPFTVAYGSNIDYVEKTVLNAIKKLEGISDKKEPSIDFIEMGDFSLNFTTYIWVDNQSDGWSIKIAANKLIYNTLNEAKIDIPFPTQNIVISKTETENFDKTFSKDSTTKKTSRKKSTNNTKMKKN